jgi:hypothetical protein
MNASEAARFRAAIALRVQGASLVPPAPAGAQAETPQRWFTDCPSACAVADMLPAAQKRALTDALTTEVRQVLDALIIAGVRVRVSELLVALGPIGAERIANIRPYIIAIYVEKAYAQTVHVTLDCEDHDSCRILSYKLYARMQEIAARS